MQIDPEKVQTQEETGEPAAIDEVEARVEAEMKIIEGRAKERVAQGLQDEKLEREGEQLQEEGKRELEEQ
jgi:trehalose-6-phosphate synthase